MTGSHQIRYVTHENIDKIKWDACISHATNGLVYAYSFYLDAMAKQWDALVLNDYDAVMPLTWNSKYGFSYLYQPAFAASLGVFGNNITEEIFSAFIAAIPSKFNLIEISLNNGNNFPTSIPGFSKRSNYVLNLNKSYNELSQAYRENHQRNINKAQQADCTIKKDILADVIIQLSRDTMKNLTNTTEEDYNNFKKVYAILKKENKAETYAVLNKQNEIMSSCVFFYSHKRVYYILVGNHPDGKSIGASHALIDAFIKDHASTDLILDFEGSDIKGLANFYEGFGAKEEIYPALRINKLPWFIRWLKK